MHVAVADGRGRLDAEEEQIAEIARPRVGDRIPADHVDEREGGVKATKAAASDAKNAGQLTVIAL